jgi:ribose 5-phosphate isomerase B
MKIYIGSDHAGFELKNKLIDFLKDLGHEVNDQGPFEYDANDDYPDFIRPVAESVADGGGPEGIEGPFGVIIGGGGQGEAIVANRVKGVRAAVFYGPRQAVQAVDVSGRESTDQYEGIKLAREHNNANVLSLAARFITDDEAKTATKLFLDTKFTGEERHVRRIKKIDL